MNRQEVQSMSNKEFREVIKKLSNDRRFQDLKVICQWRDPEAIMNKEKK